MTHSYTRVAYRDGKRFVETVELTGVDVAVQTGKRGDRADFLELINKWNRIGAVQSAIIYVYYAN